MTTTINLRVVDHEALVIRDGIDGLILGPFGGSRSWWSTRPFGPLGHAGPGPTRAHQAPMIQYPHSNNTTAGAVMAEEFHVCPLLRQA